MVYSIYLIVLLSIKYNNKAASILSLRDVYIGIIIPQCIDSDVTIISLYIPKQDNYNFAHRIALRANFTIPASYHSCAYVTCVTLKMIIINWSAQVHAYGYM